MPKKKPKIGQSFDTKCKNEDCKANIKMKYIERQDGTLGWKPLNLDGTSHFTTCTNPTYFSTPEPQFKKDDPIKTNCPDCQKTVLQKGIAFYDDSDGKIIHDCPGFLVGRDPELGIIEDDAEPEPKFQTADQYRPNLSEEILTELKKQTLVLEKILESF